MEQTISSGKVAATPILKSVPSQFFAFYSLNYSLAARLQENSRPKSPSKVETKRKLQQFTVSGRLIMNGERVEMNKKENFKVEITNFVAKFTTI